MMAMMSSLLRRRTTMMNFAMFVWFAVLFAAIPEGFAFETAKMMQNDVNLMNINKMFSKSRARARFAPLLSLNPSYAHARAIQLDPSGSNWIALVYIPYCLRDR